MSLDDLVQKAKVFMEDKQKAIDGCKELIKAFNLSSEDLFPSAAPSAAPKGDEPKKARKPAEWMYPNPDNPEESYIPGTGKPPKWWANFKAGKSDGEVAAWKDANKQKNPAYTAFKTA